MRRARVAGPVAVLLVSVLTGGCSIPGVGGGSPTPTPSAGGAVSPAASPSGNQVGSVRTVLTPLGLNIHSQPSTHAPVAGVAAQGATLTVLSTQTSGWYEVRGETVTGWVVADPSLTAAGLFSPFQSGFFGFSVLYPQTWTFDQETHGVVFRPQQGSQTIVVRTAGSPSAFGGAPVAFAATASDQEVVCGYTGTLTEYQRVNGAASASPLVPTAPWLQRFADLRLRFDASHALDLAYNYDSDSELGAFADFYNSVTFPHPLCQRPNPPAPTQPAPT